MSLIDALLILAAVLCALPLFRRMGNAWHDIHRKL